MDFYFFPFLDDIYLKIAFGSFFSSLKVELDLICTCVCFYRPLIIHFSVTFHTAGRVWQSAAREQESCALHSSCVEFSQAQLASLWGNSPQPASYSCRIQWGHATEMMVGRLNKKKTKFTSPVKRHLWDGKGMGCLELVMFCLPAGPTGVIGLEKVNDTMQLGFVHLCISHCNLKV